MHKALTNKPVFDSEKALWRMREWKSLPASVGMDRIVVEWCVTYGPKVFVYPAVKRILGFDTCEGYGDGTSDERWADLLEFEYVPQVVKALEGAGYRVQTICADQRPIQTMRQRRRDTEKLAASRGAHHAHH
ncbi:hypothetical protein [Armatimonas sp.]|uniref:hypothetical protein n=1 Tax=Armatimonas sp. TaxID=1872638 RepID=UPI00286BE899|nr:hypothetical protein [Armatimonas sp.]